VSAPPVLDHGVIGNGRVLALVSPSTHVEWLCLPRFDSPSVFARLLDQARGGSFGLEPVGDDIATRMEYVQNTNVLRTRVTSSTGSFEVKGEVDLAIQVKLLVPPVHLGDPLLALVQRPSRLPVPRVVPRDGARLRPS